VGRNDQPPPSPGSLPPLSRVHASHESFARTGESMTAAEMATYAFDQIERARTQLPRDAQKGH
jgi:hypothetical protein